MNKKLRKKFDLLNREEQKDVAELIADLASKLLPITSASKRSEDDIMKSISVAALDFWGEFLQTMCTGNTQG